MKGDNEFNISIPCWLYNNIVENDHNSSNHDQGWSSLDIHAHWEFIEHWYDTAGFKTKKLNFFHNER